MRYKEFKISEAKIDEVPDDGSRAGQQPNGPADQPGLEAGLEAGPPYPPEQVDAVKAMQRKLEALGYSVGSTGIDGKYGPRTSRAVSAYKRDNNIQDASRGRSMSGAELQAIQSATRVQNPSPTGNERSGGGQTFDPEQLAALDFGGADNQRAKATAEEFLGRSISDSHWNMLVRATVAEATSNPAEQAAIMGVILNRVRTNFGGYGSSIPAQLSAPNQFQAVTGTRYDPGPSSNFTSPGRQRVAGVAQAAIDLLPNANREWMNFTSNIPAAYGRGTNPDFRRQVASSPGSQVIGGTVFGTVG